MVSKVFNEGKENILAAYINGKATGADVRVMLLKSNTNADTANDGIVNLADLTLDEMNGANYTRKTLASEAVTKDDANDRAEYDADNVTWTALGNGTREMAGFLVYEHVDGTNANDLVIAWVEFSSTQNPGGSDFTVAINVEGLLQLA